MNNNARNPIPEELHVYSNGTQILTDQFPIQRTALLERVGW